MNATFSSSRVGQSGEGFGHNQFGRHHDTRYNNFDRVVSNTSPHPSAYMTVLKTESAPPPIRRPHSLISSFSKEALPLPPRPVSPSGAARHPEFRHTNLQYHASPPPSHRYSLPSHALHDQQHNYSTQEDKLDAQAVRPALISQQSPIKQRDSSPQNISSDSSINSTQPSSPVTDEKPQVQYDESTSDSRSAESPDANAAAPEPLAVPTTSLKQRLLPPQSTFTLSNPLTATSLPGIFVSSDVTPLSEMMSEVAEVNEPARPHSDSRIYRPFIRRPNLPPRSPSPPSAGFEEALGLAATTFGEEDLAVYVQKVLAINQPVCLSSVQCYFKPNEYIYSREQEPNLRLPLMISQMNFRTLLSGGMTPEKHTTFDLRLLPTSRKETKRHSTITNDFKSSIEN